MDNQSRSFISIWDTESINRMGNRRRGHRYQMTGILLTETVSRKKYQPSPSLLLLKPEPC